MWTARLSLIIGLWLIVSGFVNDFRNPSLMIAIGLVVLILGLMGFISVKSWEGILNFFVGVWLVLCGSWFNFFMPWNFFVTGGIVFVFAVWDITEHPRTRTSPGNSTT